MKGFFRLLILVSVAAYLCFVFVPYIESGYLNDYQHNFLSWDGYGEWFRLPDWLLWLIVGAWIVVAIGMYLFIPVARNVYVAMIIIFLAITPFSGMRALTALDQFFWELTTLLDGAILVMAYFTSVASEFTSRPNKSPLPTADGGG